MSEEQKNILSTKKCMGCHSQPKLNNFLVWKTLEKGLQPLVFCCRFKASPSSSPR